MNAPLTLAGHLDRPEEDRRANSLPDAPDVPPDVVIDVAVYAAVAAHADPETWTATITLRAIEAHLHVTRRTVIDTLSRLVEAGMLRLVAPGAGRRPAVYALPRFGVRVDPGFGVPDTKTAPVPRARAKKGFRSNTGVSEVRLFPGLEDSITGNGVVPNNQEALNELSASVSRAPARARNGVVLPDGAEHVVFDAWRQATGHTRSVLDAKRRRLIVDRYREQMNGGGHPPEEAVATLIAAAVGVTRDDWHMGANDRGRRYDSFELVFRDAAHVERFAELGRGDAPAPVRRADALIARARARIAERGLPVIEANP